MVEILCYSAADRKERKALEQEWLAAKDEEGYEEALKTIAEERKKNAEKDKTIAEERKKSADKDKKLADKDKTIADNAKTIADLQRKLKLAEQSSAKKTTPTKAIPSKKRQTKK